MKRYFAVLLLIGWAWQAHAFGRTGHQQVCLLAYQLAQPATQQRITELMQFADQRLAANKQHFIDGCVWPDEVRSLPEFSYSKNHHFLNVARDDQQVDPQDCAEVGCLTSAIAHHSALLKHLPDSVAKLQSLWFVAHFIADLHQPLHVSYADDWGGNKTAVYFLQKPSNLHGVWDSALLTELGYDADPALILTRFATLGSQQSLAWRQGNVLIWANESLRQTIRIYQTYRPGMLLDGAAVSRDGPLVEQRLLQAGVRLAWWLDQLLAQPTTESLATSP